MSMDGMYCDMDRRVDRLQRHVDSALSDLEFKVSDIQQTIDDDLEDLPRKVRNLSSDLDDAKSETDRVEEELDDRIADTERSVGRLDTRIAALERYIRLSEGAVIIDLDQDGDGSLHALTDTVAKGLNAQVDLLPDFERRQLQLAGKRLQTTRDERRKQRAAVLQAATVLLNTPASDPQRKTAVAGFNTALPKARTAHERLSSQTEEAREARQELADDDAQRARHATTINAGHRADTKLRMRLRSRISEALSGPHLLPVWFATTLGPMAPARSADDWLNAATDVLAYRITYQVTDPVVALGRQPDGTHSPRRTAWHNDLTRLLRRWA